MPLEDTYQSTASSWGGKCFSQGLKCSLWGEQYWGGVDILYSLISVQLEKHVGITFFHLFLSIFVPTTAVVKLGVNTQHSTTWIPLFYNVLLSVAWLSSSVGNVFRAWVTVLEILGHAFLVYDAIGFSFLKHESQGLKKMYKNLLVQ